MIWQNWGRGKENSRLAVSKKKRFKDHGRYSYRKYTIKKPLAKKL